MHVRAGAGLKGVQVSIDKRTKKQGQEEMVVMIVSKQREEGSEVRRGTECIVNKWVISNWRSPCGSGTGTLETVFSIGDDNSGL